MNHNTFSEYKQRMKFFHQLWRVLGWKFQFSMSATCTHTYTPHTHPAPPHTLSLIFVWYGSRIRWFWITEVFLKNFICQSKNTDKQSPKPCVRFSWDIGIWELGFAVCGVSSWANSFFPGVCPGTNSTTFLIGLLQSHTCRHSLWVVGVGSGNTKCAESWLAAEQTD